MVIYHDRPYHGFGKIGQHHYLVHSTHVVFHFLSESRYQIQQLVHCQGDLRVHEGLPYRTLPHCSVLHLGRWSFHYCILTHAINVGLIGLSNRGFCTFSYVILHFPLNFLWLVAGGVFPSWWYSPTIPCPYHAMATKSCSALAIGSSRGHCWYWCCRIFVTRTNGEASESEM